MALSQGATEQASSVEELTASLEEISSQTKQNADNANEANTITADAKSYAVKGKDQMLQMLKAMDSITARSCEETPIIRNGLRNRSILKVSSEIEVTMVKIEALITSKISFHISNIPWYSPS
jgi:hypothetical protein